ncbi:MAG: UDP-N-acetylglucosamine 1-carboxyvinyltransferase [Alphaproteobacteria bacterium]|nr:UDP-N-acetylglucosamine 1-carboxyvinyltransferase [Alphaproteobacteria bacterium]
MDGLEIEGGIPLHGDIYVSGAKNAALPLLATGLMCDGTLTLTHVPDLADTRLMIELLAHHGLDIGFQDGRVSMSGPATNMDAPYDLVSKMRASILVLGPLLARYGEARVSLPGGCAIGTRPVDLHIRAMQKLGATVELADGYIQARAPKGLTGNKIVFPFVSVGATENAMMAAACASGTSQIVNAAREPEIIDLADCLNAMGARITGQGTDTLTIEGVASLSTATHHVVADRVEAGTFIIAAAMTGGNLTVRDIIPHHLDVLFDVMRQTGVGIDIGDNFVTVSANGRYQAQNVETQPYPGFPTDLQAQFTAMMCLAEGVSQISETIFENRFMHVPELVRMGADISVDGRTAIIRGKDALLPAPVMATDLRASVSLVLAGLATTGTTSVSRIYHLDRGYAGLETKLGACGARLRRIHQS